MMKVVLLQRVADGPLNGFASPTMIDSSAGRRFSEASRTCVGLVRVTCSLSYFRDELYLPCIIGIATLLSSPYAIAHTLFLAQVGPPDFRTLEVKGADKSLDSILVHTATVRVSSLDTPSRDDCLFDLLGTNPDPPIRANRCI
jgi:hypothetical protein